mmetsp:Transcript_21618/g.30288  ORF Transcript_21618/g.30288 Transcript_21618/m.30288 type:complete len:88 (-) Transcript_21618:168-431(-)
MQKNINPSGKSFLRSDAGGTIDFSFFKKLFFSGSGVDAASDILGTDFILLPFLPKENGEIFIEGAFLAVKEIGLTDRFCTKHEFSGR